MIPSVWRFGKRETEVTESRSEVAKGEGWWESLTPKGQHEKIWEGDRIVLYLNFGGFYINL